MLEVVRSYWRVATILMLAALGSLVQHRPSAAEAPKPSDNGAFEQCVSLFDADPEARGSARCFFDEVVENGQRQLAEDILREYLKNDPGNPWLHFYLANLKWSDRSEEVETHYGTAARLLKEDGDTAGEVDARLNLVNMLGLRGNLEESERQFEIALQLAEESGDRSLVAKANHQRARQLLSRGEDLRAVYRLLRRVESDAFPGGPYELQRDCLATLAAVCFELGRSDESLRYVQTLLQTIRNDPYARATASFNHAAVVAATRLPTEDARRGLRSILSEVLAQAEESGHASVAAGALQLLGNLVGGTSGRVLLHRCMDMSAQLNDSQQASRCEGSLARSHLRDDPRRATSLIQRSLSSALKSESPWSFLYGWLDRLTVHWAVLARAEAIAESLAILDLIETLRELQDPTIGRSAFITSWSEVYYWISGRLLLEVEGSSTRNELELAFNVVERMRARSLLEALKNAEIVPLSEVRSGPQARSLSDVLKRKAEIQRKGLESGWQGRRLIMKELEEIELEEEELRRQMERSHPAYSVLSRPRFAALREIEESLAPDEAMLSFQVALWEDMYREFAGGAWLLVSTRAETRPYRLPDRVTLEPAIENLRTFDDPEDAPQLLEFLFGALLEEALADLPPDVTRLVIVPDGELHRLPFGALRSGEGRASSLIYRYQLSRVPSATFWLRLRQRESSAAERPALVLADPVLNVSGDPREISEDRGADLAERGRSLGALRYARKEGEEIVRRLGGESRLLTGEDASERALKESDVRRFKVLHLAAHAVGDEAMPQRSAVFLAPGAEVEDGWLQPGEIVELDLDDRLVVLSTCESASGRVLRGEGVLSLARAFFQAGARTVVAGLWRLPDRETAALVGSFYDYLGRGQSVAEALANAQRQRLDEGAAAKAWAGLVVLGDGSFTPFPGGLQGSEAPFPRPATLLAGALLLALALAAAWLRRRGRP